MNAFVIDRYKSKDGGRIGEMPEPELREDDVLVHIHAAGVKRKCSYETQSVKNSPRQLHTSQTYEKYESSLIASHIAGRNTPRF